MEGRMVDNTNIWIATLDDEEMLCEILSNEFTKAGYVALAYSNDKRDFLEMMPVLMPDIIITDLSSPGMNGLEFIRNVRTNPLYDNIAVIVVTGHNSPELRMEAKRLGVYEFICKPLDLNYLFLLIEQIASRLNVQ